MAVERVEVPGSANIAAFEYDPDRQELAVEFRDAERYTYLSVPQSIVSAWKDVVDKGGSVGSYFYRHIREIYAFYN